MRKSEHSRAFAVVSDADNTLWDTDKVYAESQLWLLSAVESKAKSACTASDRLKYLREVDQGIAKRHHQGLRYPSVLLVLALQKVLKGVPVGKAAADVVRNPVLAADEQSIAAQFDNLLKSTPPLRHGVREGLQGLRELEVPLLVATEGSAERCQGRLKYWNLLGHVDNVVSAPKSREFFERAAKLLKVPPSRCMTVGDQMDRDILFAAAAGCVTAYFPGGFNPIWSPAVEHVRPDYIVDTFDQIVPIVRERLDGQSS